MAARTGAGVSAPAYDADVIKRFMRKVRKRADDQCWEWQGGRHVRTKHGQFWLNGQARGAHVVSYQIFNGPIKKIKGELAVVRHTCDFSGCVNPKHLILGTIAENNRDRWAHSYVSKVGA